MAETDRNRPLYMIGVAAELAGMHPQTLRSYEQKGLVTPQRTRGNTRMYSQADIERLELINELTDEGINLAGVIRILDLQGAWPNATKSSTTCTAACAVWPIACTNWKHTPAWRRSWRPPPHWRFANDKTTNGDSGKPSLIADSDEAGKFPKSPAKTRERRPV